MYSEPYGAERRSPAYGAYTTLTTLQPLPPISSVQHEKTFLLTTAQVMTIRLMM